MRIYQRDSYFAMKAYFKKISIEGNNKELNFYILINNSIYKKYKGNKW